VINKSSVTTGVKIYIAGNYADAQRVCREFCFKYGACVTVTPTEYVYTGGQEAGVIVGFINYPRFPKSLDEIQDQAQELAKELCHQLYQKSYTIEGPNETVWFSNREEDNRD